LEIRDAIVLVVFVNVVDLHPIGDWAKERCGDKAMNEIRGFNSAGAQANVQITLLHTRTQHL
jgi:hypothetical protein